MKLWDIAIKDLGHSMRSALFIGLALAAPLLMTALFYLAFGNLVSSGNSSLPLTRVQVVDLDPQGIAGQIVLDTLNNKVLAGIIMVTLAPDEASARQAVEQRQAGLAVIVPSEVTAIATGQATGQATVILYRDPTLTIGPAIVKGILVSILDGFSDSRIAVAVADQQFAQQGVQLQPAVAQRIAQQYVEWAKDQGARLEKGEQPVMRLQPLAPISSTTPENQLVVLIMAGMLIFFTFYTGASCAESIIQEDEDGTLARLATTPTPSAIILGGKLAAVFMTVLVQVVVLLSASTLIFGIRWGQPLAVALVSLGLMVAASGFGIFVMSLIRSTRQTGPVLGGVLTLMGMAGGLFTTFIPNPPAFLETINLCTPHGWALRGLRLAAVGGGVAQVWLPILVMMLMGLGFFSIGVLAFRKRFA